MPERKQFFNSLQVFSIAEINSVIHISLKHRYVFIEMPKVASSTIKLRLMNHEALGLGVKIGNPHPMPLESPFVKPYQLDRQTLSDIMDDPTYVKFCFVRNPFTRILSAYLDKIERGETEKRQILRILGHDPNDLKREVTFLEFLKALSQMQPAQMDKHWRPQSLQSFSPYLTHGFIGKFENLDPDLKRLSNLISLDLVTQNTVHNAHKTGAADKIGTYYTEDCINLIIKVYAQDFKIFSYSTKLPVERHKAKTVSNT